MLYADYCQGNGHYLARLIIKKITTLWMKNFTNLAILFLLQEDMNA